MANHAEHASHHHILPFRVYFAVAAALLILTAITVWISFYHFGPFNLLVAMIIAAIKATLVIMFFMHLKYDNKLYTLIFVGAVAFFATFVIITMYDTMRRGDVYEYKGRTIVPNAAMYDSLKAAPTGAHGEATIVDSGHVGTMSTDSTADSTTSPH